MSALMQLPPELMLQVLSYINPEDLARVNRVCRDLYLTIKDNAFLYRSIYLHQFDEPATLKLDWIQEIHDIVKLDRICASQDATKTDQLPFVYNTVTRLLANSSRGAIKSTPTVCRTRPSITYPVSRNTTLLTRLFEDDLNKHSFLSQSFLFKRARAPLRTFNPVPSERHQQSAKLHCLYGVARDRHSHNYREGARRPLCERMYPFACSKVYDIREYTERTMWGPFMDDDTGRVDWEKVEAIMIVLASNMKTKGLDRLPVFTNCWATAWPGTWPGSYVPMPVDRKMTDLEMEDPYDVTGTWLRVVCFLDYRDFFGYNFPHHDDLPDNLPRPALDRGEATRLILMKVHVTKIEPPEAEDDPDMPVVHFEGFSRSLDGTWDENANSDLIGTVRTTKEGEVRFTTFSIFGGEARWRSEGIQIGGARASKVIGNWFDKDYDPNGPCGPSAFWKIKDRQAIDDTDHIMKHDYLPIVDGYDARSDTEEEHELDEEYDEEDEEMDGEYTPHGSVEIQFADGDDTSTAEDDEEDQPDDEHDEELMDVIEELAADAAALRAEAAAVAGGGATSSGALSAASTV